ncbi:MAG: choice-of-anchor R domain-containing protein, partial [Fimbriiglobus sp.]
MIVRQLAVVIAAAIVAAPAAAQFGNLALDNTAGGTNVLNSSTGTTLSDNGFRRKAVIFTAPAATDVKLADLRYGFQEFTAGTPFGLVVDLTAVDGSNDPTGAALASLTASVPVSTTPAYFTFNLDTSPGSTFDDYTLSAGVTYALTLRGNGPNGATTTSWNEISPNAAPTASNGFSYAG